jgi:hypothetical protein
LVIAISSGQVLARNAVNEAVEALHRMAGHVAVIQPERKFIDVAANALIAARILPDAGELRGR